MLKIVGGRGSGKTKQLMKKAKEVSGVLVCKNPDAMYSKSLAYGIIGLDIISYNDYLMLSGKPDNTFIDDVDDFMEALNVGGYTLSID